MPLQQLQGFSINNPPYLFMAFVGKYIIKITIMYELQQTIRKRL